MPKHLAPETIVSVRVPADLMAAVHRLRERDGIGTSEQIRRGLRDYLNAKGMFDVPVQKLYEKKGDQMKTQIADPLIDSLTDTLARARVRAAAIIASHPKVQVDTRHPKKRRSRGTGSVFLMGKVYWISYKRADGRRVSESSGSEKKSDAIGLLEKRNGARIHNLPIVKGGEKLLFATAAQALITTFENNSQPSLDVLKIRINKHLTPFFGNYRMAGIDSATVLRYIAHRREEGIVAWRGKRKGKRVRDVSNSEINRELGILRRIFNLAIEQDRIPTGPTIRLLKEPSAREGFFEPDQLASVLRHLPDAIRPVIEFASITGWRTASEILPLTWDRVDFEAGEVRLGIGTTKNGDARVFPMTVALRKLLEERHRQHEELKKRGTIEPLVFYRMCADHRGGPLKPKAIKNFGRAWHLACKAAGVPGRIVHDLRRTVVRHLDRSGVSRSVSMELVGHRTTEIYDRYNITSSADKREAARKLDLADGVPPADAQRAS